MGWLNPFLYAKSASFVTDITSGNNLCTAESVNCCKQGFYADLGWDPITGLGVLKHQPFLTAALVVDTKVPTIKPTVKPV